MIWHPLNNVEGIEVDHGYFVQKRKQRTTCFRFKSRSQHTNQVSVDRFSYHAQVRAAQRGLSPEDIAYILSYGQRYHAADSVFYLLLAKNIQEGDCRKMSRLIGTAIIVDKAHTTVITIWRNRQNGMRNIRRKLAAVWYGNEHHCLELCSNI